MQVKINNAFIAGFGSIGRKHGEYLGPISQNLVIVDPEAGRIKESYKSRHTKRVWLESIAELKKFQVTNFDVGVVSNWGPDHLKTMQYLSKLGVRKFVLEKPCADSLKEIDLMYALCKSQSLSIVVNQGYFYSNLGERINLLARQLELGKIVAIWITGGARCISTAGSHWISLANQIFNSNPVKVFAQASNDQINPRSSNLSYFEGVYSFEYKDGQRLGINLSNKSSIAGTIQILWRDAIGTLVEDSISIRTRENKHLGKKITLYGDGKKLIFNNKVPHFHFVKATPLELLYSELLSRNQKSLQSDFKKHLDVTRAVLLALVSSESNKLIKFHDNYAKFKQYSKKFKIS
jgi:predicted dehydrogenase